MKNNTAGMTQLMALALALAAIFLLPPKVSSQDTVTEKQDKMITVKIKMEDDGKSFDIDTTFVIDMNFDEKAFQEAMEQYQHKMKKAEQHLREIESQFNEQELSQMLCMPESLHRLGRMHAPHGIVRMRPGMRGETLSDLLGDIPMNAVKSYRVKETKNGKRITIDISDEGLMKGHDQDVFIWRNVNPHPRPRPGVRREIYIDTNVDVPAPKEVEQPEEPESPEE